MAKVMTPAPTTSETPPETPPATPAAITSSTTETPPVAPGAITEPPAPPEGETPPAEPVVPLTVESFTLPENTELDTEVMPDFLNILNDQGLSRQDLAQKLLNLQADTLKKAQETASEQWTTEQTAAAEELKNDSVVGQGNYKANLAKVSALMDSTATPEVRKKIFEHGLANDKDMFAWLIRIQDKLGEGRVTAPNTPAANEDKTLAQALYPTMQ